MTSLELLAPAKNLSCGIAAVDNGADAVYIGASQFGARVSAGNSIDDIRQLCDYAHQYGVKVYATVNTIIYDSELAAVETLIHQLYEAGADAILVQDMGVLKMNLPPIALHASTQTDNRTSQKVRWLQQQGFSRVVLARELSASEIASIHRDVPDMPLEVFVHGALCVSYSGLCYASQHCFGRSANRGACAQFCRMKFDLVDADGKEHIHQRHLLSLKDLNLSDHLETLIQAGATSFKIEGRLKDESYVKNVVAAYSQRLNRFIQLHADSYCRASRGSCTYAFTPDLNKTFNRGFTTYFHTASLTSDGQLTGRQPDIFSPDTPKAIGEYVGKVKELRRDSFNVAGTARFSNGDGLCFVNENRELEGFRVNRCEGNRLYPHHMPSHLRAGMALYRNNDQEFERQLAHASSVRKIPITMHLEAAPGGFVLSSGTTSVCISCEHQTAEKPQRDNILCQLSKLGGTPYECSWVDMAPDFNYFIPSSLLSELRRLLVAALSACHPSVPKTEVKAPSGAMQPEQYAYPCLSNISNRLAQQFYGVSSPTAYELKGGEGPLMQCRHCLRFSLGFCVRNGGHPSGWREPFYLRLSDGRRFRLEFDCRQCQMNVWER